MNEKNKIIENLNKKIIESQEEYLNKENNFNTILKNFSEKRKKYPSMEIDLNENIKHLKVKKNF
jgi:hypothetical protein